MKTLFWLLLLLDEDFCVWYFVNKEKDFFLDPQSCTTDRYGNKNQALITSNSTLTRSVYGNEKCSLRNTGSRNVLYVR